MREAIDGAELRKLRAERDARAAAREQRLDEFFSRPRTHEPYQL